MVRNCDTFLKGLFCVIFGFLFKKLVIITNNVVTIFNTRGHYTNLSNESHRIFAILLIKMNFKGE